MARRVVLAASCALASACLNLEQAEDSRSSDAGADGAVVSDGGWPCKPKSCQELGAACGAVPDGCGATLTCGTCPVGLTCGGGGPNQCGEGPCSPTTCAALGAACGNASDGCGKLISCGTCASPSTCGGAGVPNQCGCVPSKSCPASAECGSVDDGCGSPLVCGACPSSKVCGEGKHAHACLGVAGTWTSVSRTCDGVAVSDAGVSWTFTLDEAGGLVMTTQDADCKRVVTGSWVPAGAGSFTWSFSQIACQPNGCTVGPGSPGWQTQCNAEVLAPPLVWQGTYSLGAQQMPAVFAPPASGCTQSGAAWTLARQ